MSEKLRIAFITNEFVIEKIDAGGLANYLNRISRILHEQGHEVEMFVTRHKKETSRIMDYNGIRVQHVAVNKGKIVKLIGYIDKHLIRAPYGGLAYNLGVPLSLANALNERHKEAPFNIVQSSSVAFSGLFVKQLKNRVHLVRLSSIIEDCMINDGVYKGFGAKLMVYIARLSVKNADVIYAPSEFTTLNYKGLKNREIHVIRPPFFLEFSPVDTLNCTIPNRFFIHFGSIGSLKGSDTIAEALPLIWDVIPEFQMVWIGKEREKDVMLLYKKKWGINADKVIWFDGLKKDELYAVLKKAEVAVLPSKMDNLPNTVIESLFLGIPVIGSNGASINELVVNDKNGSLIEIGDVNMLVSKIINAWKKNEFWLPNGFQTTPNLQEFEPSFAANQLLKLYHRYLNASK
jgi:glycosyltransferase involved in cell wall biosynthesis